MNDHIDARRITPSLLREECGDGAYERGSNYHRQGRCELKNVRYENAELHLSAKTRGSGVAYYHQDIYIQPLDDDLIIEGECSCPVGFNCKHVVAACLTYRRRIETRRQQQADSDAFTQWLHCLSADASDHSRRSSPDYLLYHLNPMSYRNGIEVQFSVARLKKNGTFGKQRRKSLSDLAIYTSPAYLEETDREALALLHAASPSNWTRGELSGISGYSALSLLLSSARCFWGEQTTHPLQSAEPLETQPQWVEEEDRLSLRLHLPAGFITIPVTPPCYLDPVQHRVGPLLLPPGIDAKALLQAPAIPREDAGKISRLLALHYPQLPTPVKLAIREIRNLEPQPRLNIHGEAPFHVELQVDFLYDGIPIDASTDSQLLTLEHQGELLRIQRHNVAETRAFDTLQRLGLTAQQQRAGSFILGNKEDDTQSVLTHWFEFVEQTLPVLNSQGWQIDWSDSRQPGLEYVEAIDAHITGDNNDWFSLRFDIELEGRRLPLLPLIAGLVGDYEPGNLPPYLYLEDGKNGYIAIDSQKIEPVLQTIIDLYDFSRNDSELKLSRLDAPRLLELGDISIRGGNELNRLAHKLHNFSSMKNAKIPATFKGQLRDYQQQGVNWMQFLREYELSGILADDMGLGKTVQTLAHLAIEKRAGRMQHPSLIIAPTSLMGNWRREAQLFTPKLNVLVLHGPQRNAYFDYLDDYDLILTTYPLLARDHEALSERQYHYLILDEAQQIKNHKSLAAQLVRELRCKHRLCLSGTPIENHLGELWAQFDFLLPGFLGTQQAFNRNYRQPIEKLGDRDKLIRLNQRTAPFMLRRTKERVADELPAKTELLRSVPISGRQATLYESIRLSMEKRVRDAIAKKGLARSHITILDALLKLRQVCCDPRLLPEATRGNRPAPSAKLEMLMEMLPELIEEGRRILLFSQFTTMLGLIEQEVKASGLSYTKLTGQTRKRDEVIEEFRNGQVNLFLISLKAGGVGLNLTEADTVIHYDPWWNPAVEAQATDRAHRIGQDKPVFVYKLISEGTVEEKIIALQEKKQHLAQAIYGKSRDRDELPIDTQVISTLLAAD